jgi:hypothetical protein
MTRRLGTLLASVLVATGCGSLDAPPGPEVPAGCGECAGQVDDLVAALEKSGAVLTVRGARRVTTRQGYLGLGVDLDGKDVVSADMDELMDRVAEAAWKSEVTPLDTLSVDGTLRNGYAETVVYDFAEERSSFEERWGDRPPGSDWTPVSGDGEDEDAQGCEVDGCHELMRDIAREVSALPGVRAVLRADHVSSSPTNASSADIDVKTDGTDVTDQVAEIVWRSRVTPIELITVTSSTPGGGFPDQVILQIDPKIGRDHDRLEQMWGPRPVE